MEVKTYMFAHLDKESSQVIGIFTIATNSYKDALECANRTQNKYGITKRSRVYTQENFFKTPYWEK